MRRRILIRTAVRALVGASSLSAFSAGSVAHRALVGASALSVLAASSVAHAEPDRAACAELGRQGGALLVDAEKTGDVGKARAAADLFERARRVCPDDPDWPFFRALAHVLAKDEDRVRAGQKELDAVLEARAAELNRSRADAERDPRSLYLRALVHLRFGNNPAKALPFLERVQARDPRFFPDAVRAVRFKALLLYSDQLVRAALRPDRSVRDQYLLEAEKQTKIALAVVRGDVAHEDVALRNLGVIYEKLEKWVEAEEIFQDLGKRHPNDAIVRYLLATVLADQYRWSEAVLQWEAVLRLRTVPGSVAPEDADQLVDAPMRHAVTLMHAGRTKEGRAGLLAYTETAKTDARGWFYLGYFSAEVLDAPEEAVRYLETARSLDPWCERTLVLLRSLYVLRVPDPAKEKAIASILEDPVAVAARKKELDRRLATRSDRTNGCE